MFGLSPLVAEVLKKIVNEVLQRRNVSVDLGMSFDDENGRSLGSFHRDQSPQTISSKKGCFLFPSTGQAPHLAAPLKRHQRDPHPVKAVIRDDAHQTSG